jgi:hypothetical protein
MAGLVVAGCVVQRAEDAELAQKTMIGFTRAQVQDCMGPPADTGTDDGTETWTYNSGDAASAADHTQSAMLTPGLFCRANVTLKDGKVTAVTYAGRTGGMFTRNEECATLVQKCVPAHAPNMADRLLNNLR